MAKLMQKVFKQEKKAIITYAREDVNLELKELKAFEIDGAKEKHVPVVKREGNKVDVFVGEVAHPMQDVHFIEWISVETNKGFQVKYLNPEDKPEASFMLLEDEKLVCAYAYCNLHGLWKA